MAFNLYYIGIKHNLAFFSWHRNCEVRNTKYLIFPHSLCYLGVRKYVDDLNNLSYKLQHLKYLSHFPHIVLSFMEYVTANQLALDKERKQFAVVTLQLFVVRSTI